MKRKLYVLARMGHLAHFARFSITNTGVIFMSNPKRVFNFNPGPAVLPLEVLETAQVELLDFKGTGMSVMEISHRSKEFEAVIQTAEADLRELMGIPSNYKVMFLQGGASL